MYGPMPNKTSLNSFLDEVCKGKLVSFGTTTSICEEEKGQKGKSEKKKKKKVSPFMRFLRWCPQIFYFFERKVSNSALFQTSLGFPS